MQSRSPATKEQGASPQVLGEGRSPKGWVVQKTSPSRQSMPREPVLSFHISGGKKRILIDKRKGTKVATLFISLFWFFFSPFSHGLYNSSVADWELNPMLCDSLEGWDGVGDGREVQEGGDIYILVADSC